MAIVFKELIDVALYNEVDGALGTNKSGSATYVSIPVDKEGLEMTLKEEPLEVSWNRQKKFDRTASKFGNKSCTLTLPIFADGATTALSKSVAPGAVPYCMRVLQSNIGGMTVYSGSTIAAGASNGGDFSVTAGSGSQFPEGQFVGRVNSSTGKLEARLVETQSTDDLVLHQRFGQTPSADDVLYNSFTGYLQQDPTGSMQFLCQGANDSWVLRGLQGSFGFNLEMRALPKINFELEGTAWSSGSVSDVARVDFNDVEIPIFKDSEVLLYQSGSFPIDASAVAFSSLTVTPNTNWTNVLGAHGEEGVINKKFMPTPHAEGACKIEITLYFEDTSYLAAMEQGTEYGFLAQVGNQPGNTFVVCAPRCQIVSCSPRVEANDGLLGQTITLAAFDNSYGGGSGDQATSPIYVGCL